jgi:hypothetical protein
MSAPTLLVLCIFGLLIWLAARMTRNTLRHLSDQEALIDQGGIARLVVEMNPGTGAVEVVSDHLEDMHATWHPIRFPESWESRSAGFPPEKVEFDGRLSGRRKWCEANCKGRWRVEAPTSLAPVFWFENRYDADGFSLAWYPFKCL